MAFTGAMNLSIDKDDFWQLSSEGRTGSSPPPVSASGGGAFADEMHHFHSQTHTQPRFSSDSSFFDQYVNMEMEGGPAEMPAEDDTHHHSPGESFFIPLSPHEHGHDQEEYGLELAGDGLSSPAPGLPAPERSISVSGTASSHHSHRDDDDQSVDLMSIPTSISSIDGSAKSHSSFPPQSQTAPRQDEDSTNHVVLGRLNAETLEQRRRLLSGRRGIGHHQPTGGSISDSELLRLEGLSVKSPRGLVVAASAAHGVPSSSSQTNGQLQLHRSMTPSASTFTSTFTSTSAPPNTGAFPLVTSKSYNNLNGRRTGGNQRTAAAAATAASAITAVDDIDLCNLGEKRQNLKAAGSRKFESIYATIRRAVGGGQHRTRLNHSKNTSNNHHQHPKTAPIPQAASPSHTESAKKATRRLASETDLMWQGMPISPPLTDMNSHGHQGHQGHQTHHGHHGQQPADPSPFVAGLMDDPFFDSSMAFGNHHHHSSLASAAEINGKSAAFNATIPNTPLHTPNIKNETLGDDGSNFFPATSKSWSLDNRNFVTSSDMSNGASFLASDNSVMNTWSFDPSNDSANNLTFTTSNESSHSHRNHHNLTIQVPSYLHQEAHHTPGSDELSGQGLMIHMPQPLTPNSAPLLSSHIHQTHNGMSLHEASVYPFPDGSGTPQHHMSGYLQQQQQQQAPHSQSRRPKPRAPSSGARYQHHLPGGPHSMSPRKQRRPSSSSESPSPTPMAQQSGGGRRSRSMSRRQASVSGGNAIAHRKSTTDLLVSSDLQSNAVRKRRSVSSWRGPRRTASGDVGGGGGGISLDGANGGIGFVNYTPNDHNVLMTGVAPSGSSKTKMRREKEAMERQRKLSEAVVKMVTNAGVDVSMLKEEGIVI
ncbi:hypothetical protein N0V93_000187 [Gnomoniopsis smithogilvyi]|uniref:Developmental regulatory protein wetA n=1 Tax=Gnomoniopsis smithogilvyi TaxID=1191159 RepID=A0A9W8Z143_9PEZI|nr:hypothetical protein N0V93_000187 [Gnomoniopsis smithogilvyi]